MSYVLLFLAAFAATGTLAFSPSGVSRSRANIVSVRPLSRAKTFLCTVDGSKSGDEDKEVKGNKRTLATPALASRRDMFRSLQLPPGSTPQDRREMSSSSKSTSNKSDLDLPQGVKRLAPSELRVRSPKNRGKIGPEREEDYELVYTCPANSDSDDGDNSDSDDDSDDNDGDGKSESLIGETHSEGKGISESEGSDSDDHGDSETDDEIIEQVDTFRFKISKKELQVRSKEASGHLKR